MKILDGAPFNKLVDEDVAHGRELTFNGKTATFTIYWRDYDDDTGIKSSSAEFPSRLLFISDSELKKFQAEAREEAERQTKLRRQLHHAETVARAERALLARLKAKYPD